MDGTGSELVLKDEGLSQASTGLWTGVGGLAFALVGPFTCYTSYLIALPLGLFSVWSSWKAQQTLRGIESARAERQMAVAGFVTGGLSAVMSASLLFIFTMLMFLYFVIFVLAAIGG